LRISRFLFIAVLASTIVISHAAQPSDVSHDPAAPGGAAPTANGIGAIQLAAQSKPPVACGSVGSDGTVVLTQTHNLCICDATAERWKSSSGELCTWKKP
jgi:hypothetical protein